MTSELEKLRRFPFRPLLPGERRSNADGSYSTELLATQQTPAGIMNVPTLWNGRGHYIEMQPEQAARSAIMMSRMFGAEIPTYPTIDAGVAAAKEKSAAGGQSFADLLINAIRKRQAEKTLRDHLQK